MKTTFPIFILLVFNLTADRAFCRLNISQPVIALIDSGLDLSRAPELKPQLAGGVRPEDLGDAAGHGTRVAQEVFRQCPRCRLLPIKITETGAGARAEDLEAAIRRALAHEAKVINISLGLQADAAGRKSLELAVRAAAKRGALVVAAAGNGLTNPFRPEPLSTVFPQALPEVLVVGTPRPGGQPDPLSNYGPELDLAVKAESSSFAAGMVSGMAGQWLTVVRGKQTESPARLRQQLRAHSTPVIPPDFERLGFGLLSPGQLPDSQHKRQNFRVYETSVDFNFDTDILELGESWNCAGQRGSGSADEPKLRPNPLKKGRARIQWTEPLTSRGQNCRLRIVLLTSPGKRQELQVSAKDLSR